MKKTLEEIATELAGGLTLEQLRQKQGATPYEKKFSASATDGITDAGKAYLKNLAEKQEGSKMLCHRNIGQELTYDEARVKFWRIMEERAFEISGIENRDFSWQISEDMADRIKNMIRYFINDPESKYPLNKGLFICGKPGTGKSEFMQMFSRFCRENKLSKEFDVTSLSMVHTRAKTDKDFDPVNPCIQFNRCFDEFGRHVGPIIRFGDSLNITDAIIEERYERFKRYGQNTHLIANMSTIEVQDAFPPMIFDRIKSMCSSIVFGGESKRS